MIQQVSNSDRFSVGREIGKDFRERLVVAEFSVVYEQHDGHGGELLGEGSKPEIRMCVDLRFQTEIADAVTAFEHGAAILVHQHCETRSIRRSHSGENGINLLVHGRF